jgi:hypothetical protein
MTLFIRILAPLRLYVIRTFFFLLLLPAYLYGQESGKPRVLIETAPDRPVEGSMLTLTLLVDHGNPDEVNVLAPPFTDCLILDFMLKGPRLVSADSKRWTAIEFRFTLTGSGIITFEPFTIMTPQVRIQTDPFDILIQKSPGGGETTHFRLSWENVPANLRIGDNSVITLRVNGWKNAVVLPESGLFLPPVPMGHIVESLSLSEKEKSSGIALKLRIIPLQTGVLTILNKRLAIENAIYEVPGLRIPVSRAVKTDPQ